VDRLPATIGATDQEHPISDMLPFVADLAAEHADLDRLVTALDIDTWGEVTPAEPWTILDQISHLAYFDERAAVSVTDPDRFRSEMNADLAGGMEQFIQAPLLRGRDIGPSGVLAWWRTARSALLESFRGADPDAKVPWYGPDMKASSSAVARLMETWAHGQDIADALGIRRAPTDRLRRIAELGVKTFSWSFLNRGIDVPGERVRVALRGPSGGMWVWNDEAAASVTGPADEFCLVVTQRRHIDDTHLVVEGDVARRWMEVAQVFAGPPGPGRRPQTG